MDTGINYNVITKEDCIDNYEKRNKTTIINDGKIIGFEDIEDIEEC